MLERQRRARINRSLEELKGLVLSALYRDVSLRPYLLNRLHSKAVRLYLLYYYLLFVVCVFYPNSPA